MLKKMGCSLKKKGFERKGISSREQKGGREKSIYGCGDRIEGSMTLITGKQAAVVKTPPNIEQVSTFTGLRSDGDLE